MSTMTLIAMPAATARRRRPPGPARPSARPAAKAQPVPVTARSPRSTARPTAPLRLTRRGRSVLVLLLVVLALAWSLGSGTVSLAGTTPAVIPVRYVTVEAGQSLWSIAGQVAPGTDPRVTVAQIRELNALSSSAVTVGQQLAVPAGR